MKKAAKKAAPAPAPRPVAFQPKTPAPEPEETLASLADAYLADRVYEALLERGEPAKISELTLEIANPRITFPLVRRALAAEPTRFTLVERQWNLAARYLDTSRPVERTIIEVLRAAGRPLDTATIATELSHIYQRDAAIYFQLLSKVVQNSQSYIKVGSAYGLAEWVPLVDADELSDVLFDNDVARESLSVFAEAARGADWTDPAAAIHATCSKLGARALPNRIVGVLAWQALGPDFDARGHLIKCLADARLVWLSGARGGRWITRELAEKLELDLGERGATLAHEEHDEPAPAPRVVAPPAEEPAEAPAEAESAAPEPDPEPTTAPLEISESDLRAMEAILADRGGPVEAADLLALQYEVVPGDPSFAADLATLQERLMAEEGFLYVGAGRFREPNSLPLFVFSMPEFLSFPDLQFVSMDGEIMDEEIEDEGLGGTLRQDMLSPLAQDAGDDEGRYTGPALDEGEVAVRCVVKAHHKEIGTFPLCQIPDGFLPGDATVSEIVIRDSEGAAHDIIVNHELRLAFGFFGLYESLPHESGSVFVLRPGSRPYEFRFEPVEEPDAQVYVSAERLAELALVREQAEETGDMATFDIACEVIESYPKGLDFVQVLTEVNLVRRVSRRKLASILSNYYCFVQKAGTSVWRYDARKRDMGTDRAKRKYIKR